MLHYISKIEKRRRLLHVSIVIRVLGKAETTMHMHPRHRARPRDNVDSVQYTHRIQLAKQTVPLPQSTGIATIPEEYIIPY